MVFQLNGAAAGQTVFHYHAHLIPRMAGSEFKLHGRQRAEDAELEALARRIASCAGLSNVIPRSEPQAQLMTRRSPAARYAGTIVTSPG